MPTFDELRALIDDRRRALDRTVIVGVSGFGGSGKSTLARRIVGAVDGACRLRGDDFLDQVRSQVVSDDWDGVDRARLVEEVLAPLRAGRPAWFRRFDWTAGVLTEPELLPDSDVVVIDLVGLLHPDVIPYLDVSVWVDTPLEVATRRGKARDRAAGNDHDALWDEVWEPTDRAFFDRFAPAARADLVLSGAGALPDS